MCTVSWSHQPGGYHLLCNRDEKRTRAVALGPEVKERGGVRFIAPVDADFGGTWIAVNEFGVSVCLLNRGAGDAPSRRSRGLVLQELIATASATESILRLHRLDLTLFAPFTVLFLEPDAPATIAEWNGENTTVIPGADCHMPLTSSSYDPEGVRQRRRTEFLRRTSPGQTDPALLYWFHGSHGGQPDAYSPCMHRADAETVSFSWIIVTRDEVRFFYSPVPPCQYSKGEQQVLRRAA